MTDISTRVDSISVAEIHRTDVICTRIVILKFIQEPDVDMETGQVLMLIIGTIMTLNFSHSKSVGIPTEAMERASLEEVITMLHEVMEQDVGDNAPLTVTDEKYIFYYSFVQKEETTTGDDYVPVVNNRRTDGAKEGMTLWHLLKIRKSKRIQEKAYPTTDNPNRIKETTATTSSMNSMRNDQHRIVKRDPRSTVDDRVVWLGTKHHTSDSTFIIWGQVSRNPAG
ncbi:uncharacterized protein LOC117326005 isoform X1 [Pecten maximus]|uniref:uncharacterized protein LOC117326005 isoform X1 n=1 Tax=Pecten maximus TaxID=6579 RepID=UPI0014585613|nr:uncharacterized protein LOC117326005 isoform X1 [Pecten maximus]